MAVKVGIVGTGWVVKEHLAAFKKIDDAQIVAISGRNTAKAEELIAGTQAHVYDDWRRMLDREKLDAVAILLPPHLHGELEIACAACVKGVLIEKPICQNLQTALEVERAFNRAGTIVSVGYMNRYRTTVDRTRALLSSPGQRIVLVNGQWVGGIPGPLWWRNFSQSGGQFVEQCTHLVDLARYIAGEILEVSSYATRGFVTDVPDYTVEDAQVVNVRFASGAIGNFTTACHPQGFGGISLQLSSRTTQCVLHNWAMDLKVDQQNAAAQQEPSKDDIFVAQNRAFIEAVARGDTSLIRSSYADAIKTLRVTLAANESARLRQPVTIGEL